MNFGWALAAGLMIILPAAIALHTKLWVLTSISVGFLFGFFLQKGDLCGASAFSEVILMRDARKLKGLGIAILVSMSSIAIMHRLGWVNLTPKPFLLLNYAVGGAIFGSGMVLAGGCISGCIYKSAMGNLNSMVALLGIPLGIAFVEYGPLHPWSVSLSQVKISSSDGSALTLSSLTHLSFGAITLVLIMLTLVSVWLQRRRRAPRKVRKEEGKWSPVKLLTSSWKPWQAGVAIGLLAGPAFLSSMHSGRNYPLGVSHGMLQVSQLLTDNHHQYVWRMEPVKAPGDTIVTSTTAPVSTAGITATSPVKTPSPKKIVWWLVGVVLSMGAGAHIAARLSHQFKLLPKPPEQTIIAVVGGLLVGVGAGFANGCVVGNILSGWALQSAGLLVFGIVTILANWAVTYIYLMGGRLLPKRK